ncbi:MAG: hypothetical protein OSA98_20360 [Rubripirellula sp.]|nr:hypothetical protein [Rubripirellula sp.]
MKDPQSNPDANSTGGPNSESDSTTGEVTRFAIEPEVIFLHRHAAGEGFVVAKHMALGKYFRLGAEEYRIARLLNGNRSVSDIVAVLRSEGIDWQFADVAEFIGRLVTNGLVREPGAGGSALMQSVMQRNPDLADAGRGKTVPRRLVGAESVLEKSAMADAISGQAVSAITGDRDLKTPADSADPSMPLATDQGSTTAAALLSGDGLSKSTVAAVSDRAANSDVPPQSTTGWYRRVVSALSLLVCQRLQIFDGDRIAKQLNQRWGAVFSRAGCWNWLLLVSSGLLIVLFNQREFAGEFAKMFDPNIWMVLLVMWAVAKVGHELGHAVSARHHGIRVGKIGLLFFFMAPLPYVDVTDAWKLESKWKRIQIGLGGVYVELAMAAVAAWVWWLSPVGLVGHLAAQFFLVAGPGTLLVNANPLLRLDGYYVLSDLTDIPNLRMHGRNQLSALLNRWLMGTEPEQSLLKGWRRPFATVHAFCSIVFQCIWMTGLVVAIAYWMKGVGAIIAVAAIVLWVVLPAVVWIRKMWFYRSEDLWQLNVQRRRLLLLASLLPVAIHFLMTNDSPFARRIPVVVRNYDPQIGRASADAVVNEIYVAAGQHVLPGMLMLVLDNPELVMQRDDLADELAMAELRAVQFRRQGELSRSAAESENAESLRRSLAELNEQIAGLTIVAQREGYVLNPELGELIGRFVRCGDELLQVMNPQEKELLASVGESDLQAYQAAAMNGAAVTVRLRGGTRFTAIPTALQPRARRQVLHPTLAATAGGPLPVEVSKDDPSVLQSVQPQLQGLIRMDQTSSNIARAGQVGMLTISDNRSLLDRLVARLKR